VIKEQNLRHTIQYGIGIHHAGLTLGDKKLVEDLFAQNKIQVLVATATLAWGVNLPAHLVIIKGTEFFDPKTKRYEDYPLVDVLQMAGRAGRPQFDDFGKVSILVHDVKKSFYKRFIYEPFPIESSLYKQLHDHINAEIVSGTIKTKWKIGLGF
jgi:activating signal cointegrator complex subunit 3